MHRLSLIRPVNVQPCIGNSFIVDPSDILESFRANRDYPCDFCPATIRKGSRYVFHYKYGHKFCRDCAKKLPLKNGDEQMEVS